MPRQWDLSAGVAKLEQAMDVLKKTVLDLNEHWDDENYHEFVETYLTPLEPRLQRAMEAIHRVDQVLARARRECESY